MLEFENEFKDLGYNLIAGMDEAGRGPLAGRVYAAMVIMPLDDDKIIDGVNDSKKLTEKKRESLFEEITKKALAYSICYVDEKTIDEINILEATKQCMQKCLEEIKIMPDFVLVDYVNNLMLNKPFRTIVKGDALSYSIGCASILAKVARDRYIIEMAQKYPNYGFEKHKGYGTKLHYEMISKYGVSNIHRKTFLRNWKEHNIAVD